MATSRNLQKLARVISVEMPVGSVLNRFKVRTIKFKPDQAKGDVCGFGCGNSKGDWCGFGCIHAINGIDPENKNQFPAETLFEARTNFRELRAEVLKSLEKEVNSLRPFVY